MESKAFDRHDVDVVVSLTTYKPRLQSGAYRKAIESIIKQKYSGKIGISLTLFKDDEKYIPVSDRKFLADHKIDVFVCGVNLRPHLKYFFAMQRFCNKPIITVDDDCTYSENLVNELMKAYENGGPGYVYACRTHLIVYNGDGTPLPYRRWKYEHFQKEPSLDLLATGVGGVLYPPNILHISSRDIDDILNLSLTTDDIFLRKKETLLGIKVKSVRIDKPYRPIGTEYVAKYALCCSDNINGNDINIKRLNLLNPASFIGKSNCMGITESHVKPDLVVIMRICDQVETVHGKREFGTKHDTIWKCFPSLCKSISLYNESRKGRIDLVVVQDGISKQTDDFLSDELVRNHICARIIPSKKPGNIESFKTCFDYALTLKPKQFVLFIEDDYICDDSSMMELVDFIDMFDKERNSIFINPTTDMGDAGVVPQIRGKYRQSVVLPSKKCGNGIWWRQIWHSTSTFATKVELLSKYRYVFDEIFKQKQLNQYRRNRIFEECPCFQPLYPLFSHFQKQKTMYWFSEYNGLPDMKYSDFRVPGFNPAKIIDTRI